MDAIQYFLLSQQIWAWTFGQYHISMNIFWMFLLFKFWERMRFIPSVLFTFFSNVVAFFVLMGLVHGGVVALLKYEYMPVNPYKAAFNPWVACLSLGLTYALIQMLFFWLASFKYKGLHLFRVCLIALMSNMMSAIIVYKLLPNY